MACLFEVVVSSDLDKRNQKLVVCELIVQSIYVAFQVYPFPLDFCYPGEFILEVSFRVSGSIGLLVDEAKLDCTNISLSFCCQFSCY